MKNLLDYYTHYLDVDFFNSLSPETEKEKATSPQETVAQEEPVEDHADNHPHAPAACSRTRATTAARSRTRGTPRGTPTAGYPRTEFPPQTAATPARRSRGTRRCRRFSAAPRGACEIFHPCSTDASRPGIVPPRVPCVPRGSRRPPVRRSAG